MKFLKNVLIQKKATKERKINIIGRTNGTDCNMVYMDATLSVITSIVKELNTQKRG